MDHTLQSFDKLIHEMQKAGDPLGFFTIGNRFVLKDLFHLCDRGGFERPDMIRNFLEHSAQLYVKMMQNRDEVFSFPKCWRPIILSALKKNSSPLQYLTAGGMVRAGYDMPTIILNRFDQKELEEIRDDLIRVNYTISFAAEHAMLSLKKSMEEMSVENGFPKIPPIDITLFSKIGGLSMAGVRYSSIKEIYYLKSLPANELKERLSALNARVASMVGAILVPVPQFVSPIGLFSQGNPENWWSRLLGKFSQNMTAEIV